MPDIPWQDNPFHNLIKRGQQWQERADAMLHAIHVWQAAGGPATPRVDRDEQFLNFHFWTKELVTTLLTDYPGIDPAPLHSFCAAVVRWARGRDDEPLPSLDRLEEMYQFCRCILDAASRRARGQLDESRTKRRKRPGKKALKIVEVYKKHPDWSDRRIATEAGANPGHVSRTLQPIRAAAKEMQCEDLPRGRKGRDGDFVAWRAS